MLKQLLIKILLIYGFGLLVAFLFFRIWLINFSPLVVVFSVLLLLAELHNVVQFYTMLYSLWPRKYERFKESFKNKKTRINMFICVCGEPEEVVKETILAAKAAAKAYKNTVHPFFSPRVIVLNDGYAAGKDNWMDIQSLSRKLKVHHVSRSTPGGYKAGNINNGLKVFSTTDPDNTFDIVLDADFAVIPEFLLEITKPFVDPSIDFVQTPQRYKNENTWVAKASAAHQVHFFKHVCPAKGYDNALFLCGTNFAIKRSALLSVGGMDERFITEDYATSLNLHLQGKKGVFIGKPLAYGIAPSSLKSYFSQQQRWSKGTFDTSLAYMGQILFGNLTVRQRFQYIISSLYYLSGIRNFIYMLAPLPYLFFGVSLIRTDIFGFFILIYGPLFLYNFIVYFMLFEHPLKSWILDTISFPVFIASFFSSIFKRKLGFVVTIKKYQKENILRIYKLQLFVIAVLISGLYASFRLHHFAYSLGEYLNYFWVVFNIFVLSLGFYLFMKDNYVTGFDLGKGKFRIKASGIATVFERFLILVLIGLGIFFGVYKNPEFQYRVGGIARSVNAQEIPEKVLAVPTQGFYYGYYNPENNAHPMNPTVSLVQNEKTSLAMYYQDWGNDKPFDRAYMDSLDEKNVIPVVTWEPWNVEKGEQGQILQTEFSPKDIAGGKYDAFIRKWAHSAALYRKPFFLRFAHEMNGNWYAWGKIGDNTPDDYVAMWRHVYSIFQQEGATNAIWVWAPNNTDEVGSSESVINYYPGDAYVNWVGFSGFNWGNTTTSEWMSFEDLSRDIYSILLPLNKPIMVAETSSVDENGLKEAWFKDAIASAEQMPALKAMVFYNADFKNSQFALTEGMDYKSVVQNDFVSNDYIIKNPVIEDKQNILLEMDFSQKDQALSINNRLLPSGLTQESN